MWRSTAGCVQGEVRLTAAPGTSRRPSPPGGFSLCLCPFLLHSAACLTLAHPAAGGGCLNAPLPRGFPDARRLPRAANGRTAAPQLPELRAGGALCSVWASCWLQGAGIPCWRQLPVCGSPFLSVLSQLPQAGMPRQPPPQLEPLGTAGPAPSSASLAAPGAAPAHPHLQPFSNLGPAPSSPHRSHLGAPAPAGAHWEQGAITPAPQHITSSPGANPRHLA